MVLDQVFKVLQISVSAGKNVHTVAIVATLSNYSITLQVSEMTRAIQLNVCEMGMIL